MLFVAFALSFIFFSLGFVVTPNNAKYILSGYNTMTEAERAKIDIVTYLKFFKRFHIVMGLSLFAGTVLLSLINNNWASMFMTTFPLAAYAWMILKGGAMYPVSKGKRLFSSVVAALLVGIAAVILITEFQDFKSSDLVLTDNELTINGSYGLSLKKEEILQNVIVDQLPETGFLLQKVNGFAAGDYAKGRFKLKDKRVVWLFVNRKITPLLHLSTSKGDVYYNADELDIREINAKISQWRGI
ncbi:MAG TPA: DUF3784 domain-containing protein [Dyadobacter sp.]|jgi:hypothetical protein|nr:DUF3784 domain-containing protein [Dyadobacter sp.]